MCRLSLKFPIARFTIILTFSRACVRACCALWVRVCVASSYDLYTQAYKNTTLTPQSIANAIRFWRNAAVGRQTESDYATCVIKTFLRGCVMPQTYTDDNDMSDDVAQSQHRRSYEKQSMLCLHVYGCVCDCRGDSIQESLVYNFQLDSRTVSMSVCGQLLAVHGDRLWNTLPITSASMRRTAYVHTHASMSI